MTSTAGRWLHVARSVAAPPDGSNAGEVVRWHRKNRGLSQQDAARMLLTTQSRLSKIESGDLTLKLDEQREVAAWLSIPPEHFGILPDHSADAIPKPEMVSAAPGAELESQQAWRSVRAEFNANRAALGDLAADLYPKADRVPGSTVLTKPEWMPVEPVELQDVGLAWCADDLPQPPITGGILQTEHVRPLAADGNCYKRYSRALRDLARPKLLDNRFSYRLVDVTWPDAAGQLEAFTI